MPPSSDQDRIDKLARRLSAVEYESVAIRQALESIEPAPDPPGEFGEKWEYVKNKPRIWTRTWQPIFHVMADDYSRHAARAVACVNGNAGIANPAAIPELIRDLRDIVATYGVSAARDTICPHLTALDKAPETERDDG